MLEDNHSTKVCIVSETLGYCQSVNALVKANNMTPCRPDEEDFSMPRACDSFDDPPNNKYDDMLAEEEAARAAEKPNKKAEAKPKAKSKGAWSSARPMPAASRPSRMATRLVT